jgi:hypothetical protein
MCVCLCVCVCFCVCVCVSVYVYVFVYVPPTEPQFVNESIPHSPNRPGDAVQILTDL